MSKIHPFRLTAALLAGVVLAGAGCTKTYHGRVARYDLQSDAQIQPAPRTGIYTVKWAGPAGKNLQKLEGTETLIFRGEDVGFERSGDGQLIAIAGHRHFTLDDLPNDARMVVWHHRSTRPTQFGKEVDKAANALGGAAVVGTRAAAVGAGVGTLIYLDRNYGEHDRDDRNDEP